MALDQLQRLLDVKVVHSVGQFIDLMTGRYFSANVDEQIPEEISIESPGYSLSANEKTIVKYLFRDCKEISINVLDGGFSGNLVASISSIDRDNCEQAPHVLKVGPSEEIGKERMAFEAIEMVLGNNAPRIVDYVDYKGSGALKYRYASMGIGSSKSFQKIYMESTSLKEINRILDDVFLRQLGRLYRASEVEQINLLDYYGIKETSSELVKGWIGQINLESIDDDFIEILPNIKAPNILNFYKNDLSRIRPFASRQSRLSYVHGDLNGANIVVDGNNNTWIIDFFHTHRGHVLRDLIKLENDLLYIFTKIEGVDELHEAISLTNFLLEVDDLGKPLGTNLDESYSPTLKKAFQTIRQLRSYFPELVQEDRDPFQLLVGQLRYSVHTISFSECNIWQKKWALYASGIISKKIADSIEATLHLRVDWIPSKYSPRGRLGITILPGRKDRNRDLLTDLQELKRKGVTRLVSIVTDEELSYFGVSDLQEISTKLGLAPKIFPLKDQKAPSENLAKEFFKHVDELLKNDHSVVVHCVGGLGRSGTLIADYLKRRFNLNGEEAIKVVRTFRSQRAVESLEQEKFLLASFS